MPELAPRHPRTLIAAVFVGMLLATSLTGCSSIGNIVVDQLNRFTEGRGSGDEGEGEEYDPSTAYDEGNTDIYDIEVGDCVDDEAIFGELAVSSLDVVDCAETHNAELYGLWNLPPGEYPGYYKVDELINEGCEERFEEYVGAASRDTDLAYFYFYPTEENWEYDRGVICLAVDYDEGTIEGSVRDMGPTEPVPSEG